MAGSQMGVMPIIGEKSEENQGTELKQKYPGIFLDSMVTRSHSHKLKQEGRTKEKDEGVEVQWADTLFDEMVKQKTKQVEDQAEVFSSERLMELQQKDETIKDLYHKAYSKKNRVYPRMLLP